ncbi:MAG: hypothetical protein AAF492_06960, partial [Verrucomicrobiota bacterium]
TASNVRLVIDGHVVSWTGMNEIRRAATDRKDLFQFGGDHLFQVHTSFTRAMPQPVVVLRETCTKADYFELAVVFFQSYAWSERAYRGQRVLMLFNPKRDLTHLIPLRSKVLWSVPAGDEAYIPVGAFLRRKQMPVPFDARGAFKLFIESHRKQAVADGRLTLDILLLNESGRPLTVFWPETFEEMMRKSDAYFDIYRKDADLWTAFTRPPGQSVLKDDFKRVRNSLSLSYEAADLSPYYDLTEAKGVFQLRLFLNITQNQFVDPDGGDNPTALPNAWTGFIGSNVIEIEL